jgi:hypothetical protein
MFSIALILFDAIPTCWVSNHNSVDLIMLHRRAGSIDSFYVIFLVQKHILLTTVLT